MTDADDGTRGRSADPPSATADGTGDRPAAPASTPDGTGDPRAALATYAQLVRVPNLFTAPPDIVLGAALAAWAGRSVGVTAVAGLAVASTLLYAAGTTLNDAFDAPEDAADRPRRPIPSGRVARRAAFALGAVLLLAGIAVAGAAAGLAAAAVAGTLAAAIVLYDGALKGSAVGFLAMGLTRGLNVVLGTTGAGTPVDLPAAALAVPAVVTVYVAAVTYMAAGETEAGGRGRVILAGAGAALAAGAVVGVLALVGAGGTAAVASLALAAAFLWWVGRPLRRAYVDPVPGTLGPAVGACVLGLVVLDAAFAAVVGVGWAVAALAFLAPAVALSRVFEVS